MATVDINGGSIDGTTIGSSTPSTVGATTIDASGDVTFNGDNFVSYAETSIHNNLIVLDNTTGTTTQFSVNEANGNTMIAGALDMTNFDVDASGNLDLDANLDMDGTLDVTGDASVSTFDSSGETSLATGGGTVTVASTGVMTTVKGTLNVDEAVTLDGTLDVTGDASVSTFDSSGETSLATGGGTVTVASTGVMTTVKGTLNVDEAVTLDGTLDVTGDASVSTFDSSGETSLATGGGTVTVASTGVMTTVKGTLNVDEAVTLDGTLDVTGDASVSTFDSSGETSLATGGGTVTVASSGVMTTVKGTLNVDEAVTLDGTLDVDGDTDLDDTDVDGTLDVTGVATLATVDINGGSIDGTTIGSSTPSTVGATTIDASGDVTFNGDNFVSYAETSIHNNLIVLDNTTGTTTQFSVNEANGNTMIAGALDMTNFDVDASGNLDLDANLDMDGTTADFQASGAISLDAGLASNFTTTAGALTLEGAGGVTVTSTGGTMALNGAGQTVDLDATTLDVDATTITVDATTTTFTGDVKGPRSTGDDEFVTYAQLDSMANMAPFNETYKTFKYPGGTTQSFPGSVGGTTTRMTLSNDAPLNFYYTELSDPVTNPAVPGDPPYSVQSTPGGWHLNLSDAGIYQYFLSIEFENTSTDDAFVVVEVKNYDVSETFFIANGNTRVVSSESENLYGSNSLSLSAGKPIHLNTSMTFETDNDDEDLFVDVTVYDAAGGSTVVLESMSFSVSRIGEE